MGELDGNGILTFGKFKGRTLESVRIENAGYLVWCAENIDWFCMSEAFAERVAETDHRQKEERSIQRDYIRSYGRFDERNDWGGLTDADFC